MNKHADITLEKNIIFLSGDLNFFNVMSVYEKSLIFLKKTSPLHFDFSKLQSSDSSGLALILEWIKFAETHHKPIQFSHFPQSLLTIAQAASLEHLLNK